jgi:cell division protein FtsW
MTRKKIHPDYILLLSIILLNIIGLIALAGASAPKALQSAGKTTYFLFHQIIFGSIPGVFLGLIFYKIDVKTLKKLSFWLFIFAFLLTIAVFLPKIGLELGGGRRWIRIFNFTFQPSEFLKLAFILYLAAWMTKMKKTKKDFSHLFLPFLTIVGLLAAVFILQPDISTFGVIVLLGAIIYFSAETPISHILLLGLIGILALSALVYLEPYRFSRLFVFLNPEADPLGQGYQIKQSLIAVGSGGLFGKGLGLSEQKFGFLPQPITDSIFAIFAEETGFIGSVVLLLLFLIFAWQGFKIAKNVNNEFLRLVAIGITSWITIQAFINIGAMIGILPLTGIPLPFLSYGGSALICELAASGLLLNISKQKHL